MKGADKRAEILQVALELLVEHGFHGVPVSLIAQKAHMAAGTIYLYFASKDALITELFQELERGIAANILPGYPAERPVRERFLYLTSELLRYFSAHPLHFRYMEQYFNSPYGVSLHRDRLLGTSGDRDVVREMFAEGVARQILKDLPLIVLFSLAFGVLLSLLREHIRGLVVLDDALIRKTAEACWDAVKR